MENGTTVSTVVETTKSYLVDIVGAIAILIIGFALGILIKKVLYRILHEIELNNGMAKVGITYNLEKGVSSIISYIIYLVTIVMFLDQLGLRSIVLYIIVGAVLMIIILTILVGVKDIVPNFVAWFLLQRKGRIKEGKRVEIKEISGTVEKVGYLETEIRTERGDTLYVPNNLFIKSKFWIKK
ncbi:hypothetical protein COV17_02215 [Candidatus Woesearchaeota archaeon CG10_big_fil_rev_8_21_14_0_10_36_11]|nr:MAG: hypothetical protein COV17_02215 [Candidatus Woesearchaeota archaeon CG10_big_fil_rev_8_21_14_0_10_36_11]